MDKYRNKYRISSARAQWWDYAWDASYFITICTRKMQHFFGRVHNKKMELSPAGIIADRRWRELTEHAKNIELGEHVVMPNHMHGIITLKGNASPFLFTPPELQVVQTRPALSPPGEEDACENEEDYPDEFPQTIGRMRFRNPGKNTLSTILGGYKSGVSRELAEAQCYFGWHARFHDHIIRDAEEYQRIRNYILNNPAQWKADKFYSDSE
jgi:REP element-mobilizing transposase RayT